MALSPLAVPVTVRFKGFAVDELRPVTVSTLDCPAGIEPGVKVQVALLLQDSATFPRKVLGPAAEMVKVAVLEPIRVTFDRALEERENSGVPVPDSSREMLGLVALDVICTEPVTLPVEVGVKLTVMVHA